MYFTFVLRDQFLDTLENETDGIVGAFKIYLQMLLSQALDSNFVEEIVKEQGIGYAS